MRTRHDLTPDVITYNSLMQALASSGRVEEGFAVLRDFEAAGLADTTQTYLVHRTLLQACRASGTAAQVDCVQAAMSRRGLSAVAAVCRSTYGGEQLLYTNADFFMKEFGGTPSEIGLAARELWVRLGRSRSYKPVFEALPYAVTLTALRPAMMRSLQSHAEKLMLADLLAREEKQSKVGGLRHNEQVELSVNFKMCGDCHAFFKGASALIGRQLIVREQSLTHIFNQGDCTCGDRWRWETRSAVPTAEVSVATSPW